MTTILSSPRRRRRLAWAGAFALLAALVAGVIVAFPSPHPPKEELTNVRGGAVKAEKPRVFAPSAGEVLRVARRFIATAVARRHVEDSWDLVAPSLKRGYTKQTWRKGNIPVTPYPVYEARWRIGYSFEKEIDLQVALFAKPKKKKKIAPLVFDLTLQRVRRSGHVRWLVSSFLPAPTGPDDADSSGSRLFNPLGTGTRKAIPGPRHASTTWLLLPAGIFGLLLLVLAALAVRGWRGARLYRAYVRERQTSSSRPS